MGKDANRRRAHRNAARQGRRSDYVDWAKNHRLDFIDWCLAERGEIRRGDIVRLFGRSSPKASLFLGAT